MKKNNKISKRIILIIIILMMVEIFLTNVSLAEYATGIYPHDTDKNPTWEEVQNKTGFKLTYFGRRGYV